MKNKFLFFIAVLLICISCSNNREQPDENAAPVLSLPPLTDSSIIEPLTSLPDTCQPPLKIIIPEVSGTSFTYLTKSGKKTVPLSPPITHQLQVLKDSKGETIKSKDGKTFVLGQGGISHFTNFTTDQGLALDAIGCSYRDRAGNLWFGTNSGGVSRYDGKSFTNYTTSQGLADNTVFCITEDKAGNLWFGANGGGASRYDGKCFTNFGTEQGLPNNMVWAIKEDKKGNLWFATEEGISCYDGRAFTNYTTSQGLAHNEVLSITEDKAGNLWFGTSGGGISCYDGKSFRNFTKEKNGLVNNTVWCITEDKAGNLWFGGNGGGVSRYDGKIFTTYFTSKGLAGADVRSIIEDRLGNLWFAADGGISCYDGKSFTTYTTEQGLANNNVWSITEDLSGNLWFGTDGGGVSCYHGRSVTNYTTAHGLASNTVLGIMEDNSGNLWFGADAGGVSRYDGISFTNFNSAQGLIGNTISSITKDKKGNLWFGTKGKGVSCYDGESFTTYTTEQGLSDNRVRGITEDKNGKLWFSTYAGVSCYDGKCFKNYTSKHGLANNMVWSSIEDKSGNLWFATSYGLSRYNGRSFTNYTTAHGLASNMVYCIAEDKFGNLWFGTNGGGISRFDGKSFMNYSAAQGLPDNVVTEMIIAKTDSSAEYSGGIAMGTNFGLGIITAFAPKAADGGTPSNIPAENSLSNADLAKYTPVVETYNSNSGFPIKDINVGQHSMFIDSKGALWAGTGSDKTALVKFDYAALLKSTKPPPVVIQNIRLNQENICWYNLLRNSQNRLKEKSASAAIPGNAKDSLYEKEDSLTLLLAQFNAFGKSVPKAILDSQKTKYSGVKFDGITKFQSLPENLVLPYKQNKISFEFNAIETGHPQQVNYQYILDGYDREWSPVTNKTIATFGNIYEGTYTFKLKAQSPFGVWSDPVEYTFTVLPPWWRNWWVYALYVVLAISAVFAVLRLNSRRLRIKADQLTEEVRKATVTIIEQKKEVEEKSEKLGEALKGIRDSINYAKRIQGAMLPHRKDILAAFPQSFILFKPKDVVSGDFYFFHHPPLKEGQREKIFIAAADCTGHGVPGAFMSMIGAEKLNDAVSRSSDTSEILSLLNKGIKTALKQSGSNESTRDGMDIAFCCIEFNTPEEKKEGVKLTFAGANRPLWIIRKGHTEIEEIKATKKAIGGLTEDNQHFESQNIELQKGDTFYVCTDGYADQFGGEAGKKLMTKKLKAVLLEAQNKPMNEQEHHLNNVVEKWKAGNEQVDDILIIGVRI